MSVTFARDADAKTGPVSSGNGSRGTKAGVIKTGPWTGDELQILRKLAGQGAAAIAQELQRSPRAVRRQAHRMRISLRPPGERRGRILGLPRGAVAARQVSARIAALRTVRREILAGRLDPAHIERRARLLMLGREICPSCGIRPIEVRSIGFCSECQVQALGEVAASHVRSRELLDQIAREREEQGLATCPWCLGPMAPKRETCSEKCRQRRHRRKKVGS